jgi:CBS domain-containing protein
MDKPWKTVAELLGARRDVFRISADESVFAALQILAAKDVGALMVCSGDGLVGVVTERDCARKVELLGRTVRDTKVQDIMTRDVRYVTLDHKVDHCVALMKRHRLRHLPVVQDGKIVGVLSNRDVVEEMITEEERLIRDLEAERLVMTTNTGTY